jgi:hypothetical protein
MRVRSAAALWCTCLVLSGCDTGGRGPDRPDSTLRADEYVGMRYHIRDLPQGVTDEGGMMIESPDEHEYGVGFRRATDGRQSLWLQRLTARDAGGRPSWEVLAVLELPPLADDEHMMPLECSLADEPGIPVIAVGSYPDYDEAMMPRAAWRVDAAGAAFVPAEASHVECRTVV